MRRLFSGHGSWVVATKRIVSTAGIAVSAVGLFGAAPAGAAPAISAIAAGQITATSAVITWKTDVPGDSYVSYVSSSGSDAQFATDATLTTNHSLTLTGLQPSTSYSFTVNSADSQGDNAAVNGTDFTTLSSGGAVSPNPPAPTDGSGGSGSGGAVSGSGLSYAELQSVYGPKFSQPVYPTGTLAKEGGVIYFLMGKDGVKIPFTSMAAFTGLGYKTKNVQTLDLGSFRLPATNYTISAASEQHPWGQVLEHKGTLYYSHMTGMVPIPTMDIFNANGLKLEWVVPMNAADVEVLSNYPVMYPMEAGDDRIL